MIIRYQPSVHHYQPFVIYIYINHTSTIYQPLSTMTHHLLLTTISRIYQPPGATPGTDPWHLPGTPKHGATGTFHLLGASNIPEGGTFMGDVGEFMGDRFWWLFMGNIYRLVNSWVEWWLFMGDKWLMVDVQLVYAWWWMHGWYIAFDMWFIMLSIWNAYTLGTWLVYDCGSKRCTPIEHPKMNEMDQNSLCWNVRQHNCWMVNIDAQPFGWYTVDSDESWSEMVDDELLSIHAVTCDVVPNVGVLHRWPFKRTPCGLNWLPLNSLTPWKCVQKTSRSTSQAVPPARQWLNIGVSQAMGGP